MKILIIYAMEGEGLSLVDKLQLQAISGETPYKKFIGKLNDHQITLSFNGKNKQHGVDAVGTTPAVINVQGNLLEQSYDLVINAGTAGAFYSTCEIGDVFLSDKTFYFHDRRIEIPEFTEYGRGHIPARDNKSLARDLNVKLATVSTGNSLNLAKSEEQELRKHPMVVKEMEGAAIAYTCQQYDVDFMAAKAVTDFIDHHEESSEQFFQNLLLAQRNLTDFMINLLGKV